MVEETDPADPFKGMKWINAPKRSKWDITDGRLKLSVPSQTDLWRGTKFGFTKEDAPYYFKKITGDFQVTCHIKGKFDNLYDQGGILIRASKTVYLKCGIEYFKDQCYASTCVTKENSDWSLMPLPEKAKQAWFVIKRIGDCVQVYSSQDGVIYNQVRLAVLTDEPIVKVGLFGACPQGTGFKIYFEHFSIEEESGEGEEEDYGEEYSDEGDYEEGEYEEGEFSDDEFAGEGEEGEEQLEEQVQEDAEEEEGEYEEEGEFEENVEEADEEENLE